jgi:preprotein translocase subunit SecY
MWNFECVNIAASCRRFLVLPDCSNENASTMSEAVAKRLLATVAFIALFYIVGLVPLPTVDKDYLRSAGGERRVHVTALGIRPWVVGFMFVELLSFVFKRGRQLRRGGKAGRRRLNVLAFRTSIVLAVTQAPGVAVALSRQGLLVPNSLFGGVVTVITYVAGSVPALLLAQAVSRWGLGNGFCLFLILPVAEPLFQFYRGEISTDTFVLTGVEPLLAFAAVGLLIKMFVHGRMVVLGDKETRQVSTTFSAFPQGLVPVTWTYGVFSFLSTLSLVGTTGIGVPKTPIVELCTAVLIVAFSLCTFHLFSSPKRLDSNLPDGALPPGDDPSLSPMAGTGHSLVCWFRHRP